MTTCLLFGIENKTAWSLSGAAARFHILNALVKKEKHGSRSRNISHTLQRRLLTLDKPTEQKLRDNQTQYSSKVTHMRLLGVTKR